MGMTKGATDLNVYKEFIDGLPLATKREILQKLRESGVKPDARLSMTRGYNTIGSIDDELLKYMPPAHRFGRLSRCCPQFKNFMEGRERVDIFYAILRECKIPTEYWAPLEIMVYTVLRLGEKDLSIEDIYSNVEQRTEQKRQELQAIMMRATGCIKNENPVTRKKLLSEYFDNDEGNLTDMKDFVVCIAKATIRKK